jgi:hypothetical protein
MAPFRSERVANWVDVDSMDKKASVLFERDDPRSQDNGRRCSPGYVTVSMTGCADAAVFSVSALRRALDEFERVEGPHA